VRAIGAVVLVEFNLGFIHSFFQDLFLDLLDSVHLSVVFGFAIGDQISGVGILGISLEDTPASTNALTGTVKGLDHDFEVSFLDIGQGDLLTLGELVGDLLIINIDFVVATTLVRLERDTELTPVSRPSRTRSANLNQGHSTGMF